MAMHEPYALPAMLVFSTTARNLKHLARKLPTTGSSAHLTISPIARSDVEILPKCQRTFLMRTILRHFQSIILVAIHVVTADWTRIVECHITASFAFHTTSSSVV